MDERIVVPGSERDLPSRTIDRGVPSPDDRVELTVLVRRRADVPPARPARPLSREEFARTYGADEDDLAAVARFAADHRLEVVSSDPARRTVALAGTVADVNAAFGTTLRSYECDGKRFRGRIGPLTVPRQLGSIVEGVFGLDDRPQARTQFQVRHPRAVQVSYTPPQIASLYGFPSGVDGRGQTIALIELGGGYAQADLDAYFASLGITTPSVTSVAVDGAANQPTGDPSGPDGEVLLDIEVAGAIAAGASIVVYFAPNSDRGFLDAVTTAVHDTMHAPTVVSISWGGPESTWTQQARSALDQAFADAAQLGVTVCVAAGDSGSSDGVGDGKAHVDFPASSPHALACGGTTLRTTTASGQAGIASETVWNESGDGATGGGISDAFALPTWQSAAGVPPSANDGHVGRGVPDVAGDADPATGYQVRIDGTTTVIGGTSAVAPLWAALVALLNQHRGTALGFVNPLLYAHPDAFRDVTSGTNGAYAARSGWDACTGLGSPNGAKLLAALASA
jgi:kumamolisin